MVSTLKYQGQVVVPKARVAKSFFPRLLGLMGKKGLAPDEALIFPKCNSVHTFFMRFPIDVVMVSAEGRVVDIVESMRAWRCLLPRMSAKHTIELQAGRSRELGIQVGEVLSCEGAWS